MTEHDDDQPVPLVLTEADKPRFKALAVSLRAQAERLRNDGINNGFVDELEMLASVAELLADDDADTPTA